MYRRRFMWGLSNGVLILGLAGCFWMGIAASRTDDFSTRLGLLDTAGVLASVLGFLRLRRKSEGFQLSEMKGGSAQDRRVLRQINAGFRKIVILETVLVSIAVGLIEYFHREDLLWPAIGLAVSLHFIPLARLFRVRTYYTTATLGVLVCLAGLARPAVADPVVVGFLMAIVMWGSAAWLVVRCEHIASAGAPAESAARA